LVHTFPFEWIPRVLPVRYSARVTPEVLKAVLEELLVHEHAGSAAAIRAIDDDLLLAIKRLQSMLQVLEMDRTGNTLGSEHPVSQTVNQLEVIAAIQLFL
jgi:hypothetical protein